MNLTNGTTVLFVKDAAISKAFYTEVLNFTEKMNYGGTNIIFNEGFTVWQIKPDNIIPKTLGVDNILDSNKTGRFELCFETDDIDTIYQKLKDNNVKFLHEINTEIWGQRTIRFYDPDGHLIEVGEAMPIFLRRIYDEEKGCLEATSKRTFVSIEALKHFLAL